MKQKKTLKLWQMIVLVVLLTGITITMFFPIFKPTGAKTVKYMKALAENYAEDESLGTMAAMFSMGESEEMEEKLDKKYEDAGISSVNGLQFISGSFLPEELSEELAKYREKDEEELSDSQKMLLDIYAKYGTARVALCIFYIIPLLFGVWYILAFCMKWGKTVISIVTLAMSAVGAGITGVFYFLMPQLLKGSVQGFSAEILQSSIGGSFGGIINDQYENIIGDLLSAAWKILRGSAGLIAFILFLLIVAMAVVTLVMGGKTASASLAEPSLIPPFEPAPEPQPQVQTPQPQAQIPQPQAQIPQPQAQTPQPQAQIPQPQAQIPQPQAQIPQPQAQTAQPQAPAQKLGRVRCIAGNSNVPGYKLPEQNKIIVGTNPTKCQIVIQGAPHVSNIHCSIRYNAQSDIYIVKDHSSNGTFVNGVRLPKDQPVDFKSGTVLVLADGSSKLRLGE